MLFNTTQPTESFVAPKQTSNNPWLQYLGFNSDGSRNTLGTIESWLPGIGLGSTAIAQNVAGGDVGKQINGYQKGNLDKLLLEGQVAGTVLGGVGLLGSAAGAGVGAATDATSADGATIGFADSPTAAADVSSATDVGSTVGGAGNWMDFIKKAGNIVKPLTNLTSGADNNNYQAPINSFTTQNYNQ